MRPSSTASSRQMLHVTIPACYCIPASRQSAAVPPPVAADACQLLPDRLMSCVWRRRRADCCGGGLGKTDCCPLGPADIMYGRGWAAAACPSTPTHTQQRQVFTRTRPWRAGPRASESWPWQSRQRACALSMAAAQPARGQSRAGEAGSLLGCGTASRRCTQHHRAWHGRLPAAACCRLRCAACSMT